MAQASIGTKLEVERDNDWIEITDVQSIPEVGGDPQEIDTTNLTQREASSVPGVKQTSALAIVCFFNNSNDDDNYRIVRALEIANEYNNYRITYPDGTMVIMNAKVTTKLGSASVNSAITFTMSLFKKGDYVIVDPEGPRVIFKAIPSQAVNTGSNVQVTVEPTPTSAVISAESSNEEDATVSVSGTTITIQGVSTGAATITVKGNASGYSTGITTFTVIVNKGA